MTAKRFFLSLALLFMTVMTARSQSVYESRVTDAVTGEAVPFATIFAGTGNSTIANSEGEFRLTAGAADMIRISCVGYATVNMRADALGGNVRLSPAAVSLDGVTVRPYRPDIDAVIKATAAQMKEHRKETANYLYRQTTAIDGHTSSMVEAIINARSAISLRDMMLVRGRISDADRTPTDGYSYSANFHTFSQIELFSSDYKIPLTDRLIPLFANYARFYDVSHSLTDDNGRRVAAIRFTPKRRLARRMMECTLHIDTESLLLLKAEGLLLNETVVHNYGRSDSRDLPADIRFTVNFSTARGFSEIETVAIDASYITDTGKYRFTSLFYNTGTRDITGGHRLRPATDLRRQIVEAQGDDSFWKRNEIVRRTAAEQSLASAGSGATGNTPAAGDAAARLYEFAGNIGRFNAAFPQEKVYLHFDNTGYFRGETIWFKAYVVRADNHHSTDMSRVLYVELLNPSGDVVETRKLKIENGQADGSINLGNLLGSGFYEVRAYTRYMLNWDAAGIFSRVFPVFNAPKNEGDYSRRIIDEMSHRKRLPDNREQRETGTERLNVRFYPEGGRLVHGLCSRVAFEVTDATGAMTSATGLLTMPDGTATVVKTVRGGRGVFSYTPAETPAVLTLSDSTGRSRNFTLPEADASGHVMTVNAAGEEDHITVSISGTDDTADSLGLAVVSGGNVCAFDIVTPEERPAVRSFRRAEMEDGVSQIVLISPSGDVVAQRMVFIKPESAADTIGIELPDGGIVPGGMASLNISTRPATTLSVAVRDHATEVNGQRGNAATWLLLSSELKGYIDNPEYYFESDNAEHRLNADLLMMVQGWRRYDMARMMHRTTTAGRHYIEDALYVTGRVRPASKKGSAAGIPLSLTLYNRGGAALSGAARTDSTGAYAFSLPDCEGEWVMLMDTRDAGSKTKKYYIGVDRNFSPTGRNIYPQETVMTPVNAPLNAEAGNEDDGQQNTEAGNGRKGESMTARTHHLKNVKVRGHRPLENARAGWESEKDGAFRSILRYDCDKAADQLADEGQEMPEIFKWLATRNKFLQCDMQGGLDNQRGWVSKENTDTVFDAEKETPAGFLTISPGYRKMLTPSTGLSYKNRPIVVILNNCFYTVANCPEHIELEDIEYILKDTHETIPVYLDEFKAVYISEDDQIWTHYLLCPKLEGYSPATVFLYGHHSFPVKHKGLRRTHFEGYTAAASYEMPGHSPLPPAEDHRRTVYWNPSVVTDSLGHAKISFYNSPECRQITVSAEGISADGHVEVNR